MTLRERLLTGERVKVQGKYSGTRFHLEIRHGELGTQWLTACDSSGLAFRKQNVQWGTDAAESWIRGVRVAISTDAGGV